ncbi:coatomer subunit beta [Nowakowskiella sp. JEL0078]|nr:coatomer subunit beta [Nowakowskiella sp. JEL0078]
MISSRNVDEVVGFLKKELLKTHEGEYEKNNEYRQMLIQSIHSCAIKFQEVAASVVHVLMEFLGETHVSSAVDVISFVREVMEKFPHLRSSIVSRLIETFPDMKTGRVFRGALWIIGEYALSTESIEESLKQIRVAIGEIPILQAEQNAIIAEGEDASAGVEIDEKKDVTVSEKKTTQRRVLADGTYASESAFSNQISTKAKKIDSKEKPTLRSLLINADYFLGAVLATSLTKLVLRYGEISTKASKTNQLRAEVMLILTSIIRVGKSEFSSSPIDEDSNDRISVCLRVLSSVPGETVLKEVFVEECRKAYAQIVEAEVVSIYFYF